MYTINLIHEWNSAFLGNAFSIWFESLIHRVIASSVCRWASESNTQLRCRTKYSVIFQTQSETATTFAHFHKSNRNGFFLFFVVVVNRFRNGNQSIYNVFVSIHDKTLCASYGLSFSFVRMIFMASQDRKMKNMLQECILHVAFPNWCDVNMCVCVWARWMKVNRIDTFSNDFRWRLCRMGWKLSWATDVLGAPPNMTELKWKYNRNSMKISVENSRITKLIRKFLSVEMCFIDLL